MARNGSGTYILPPSNPVVSGTVIESDWANDTMSDLAAAITQSIAYDGQTVPIANLPMGGFHHTNVSDPVSRNQYASLGMVQDGRHQRVQITSGVDNLVGTLIGGATAYVAGALVSFFAPAANTGPMTLNYNGIGARGLISASGLPLVAGNVKAGDFLMAIYDGVQFKLISAVAATVATAVLQLATTGQQRPGGVAFPPLTIATGTSVNIPAGTAWIIPPNSDDPGDAVPVSWAAQTITLGFLSTSFTTTIAVNNSGQIVQFAGRVVGANLRGNAVLGVVEHITGVANKVITKPIIFGDDGYRGTDVATLLGNSIINGCIISPDLTQPLQLDIAAGAIFMPGGDANTINSPNQYAVAQQTSIQFRTLAGQNTLGGGVIANAPVASYDPNGLGVVTAIPGNNDCVIHRLYYLYGSFIWVYGQKIYSSVENALSMIEWDRTQYKASLFLLDATLVAEIACIKNTANLANIAQAAIVAPGAINFSIGSPGGITEAPIDGTPYGRQDAAWTQVLRRTSPTVLTNLAVNGPSPSISQVQNPAGPGTIGLFHNSGAFGWFSIETTNPDDKTYFRSRNPANSALRFTTSWNLANGVWDFPVRPIIAGVDSLVTGPAVAVDNDVARFSGTTGRILKAGLQYQSNQFDTGAGKLLLTGAFGVGGSASLAAGTNLNGVVNSGFYRILGAPVNGPTTGFASIQDGELLVVRGLDTIAQTVFSYQSGLSWTRAGSPPDVGGAGAWSAWRVNISHSETYQPAGTDLNNIRVSGFYSCLNGAPNAPIASYGHLIVHAIDSNTVMQYYSVAATSYPQTFQRSCSGGVWQPWMSICMDSRGVLVNINGNYSNGAGMYVRKMGNNIVNFTGTISRPQPPAANDVCAFIPAGFLPFGLVGWTSMWTYDNLASQMVDTYVDPTTGYVTIGFVITIGGAPGGTGRMRFCQTWTTN